ncbi:hypothetical protein GOP47_0018297, partial [Adiantum capillus-veneris]
RGMGDAESRPATERRLPVSSQGLRLACLHGGWGTSAMWAQASAHPATARWQRLTTAVCTGRGGANQENPNQMPKGQPPVLCSFKFLLASGSPLFSLALASPSPSSELCAANLQISKLVSSTHTVASFSLTHRHSGPLLYVVCTDNPSACSKKRLSLSLPFLAVCLLAFVLSLLLSLKLERLQSLSLSLSLSLCAEFWPRSELGYACKALSRALLHFQHFPASNCKQAFVFKRAFVCGSPPPPPPPLSFLSLSLMRTRARVLSHINTKYKGAYILPIVHIVRVLSSKVDYFCCKIAGAATFRC